MCMASFHCLQAKVSVEESGKAMGCMHLPFHAANRSILAMHCQ